MEWFREDKDLAVAQWFQLLGSGFSQKASGLPQGVALVRTFRWCHGLFQPLSSRDLSERKVCWQLAKSLASPEEELWRLVWAGQMEPYIWVLRVAVMLNTLGWQMGSCNTEKGVWLCNRIWAKEAGESLHHNCVLHSPRWLPTYNACL